MLWWSEYELLWSASTPMETREFLICKQTTHVSFWPSSTFCRAGLRSSRSSATCSRGASGAEVASVAAYPACRTYLSVVLSVVARCRSKRNQAVQAPTTPSRCGSWLLGPRFAHPTFTLAYISEETYVHFPYHHPQIPSYNPTVPYEPELVSHSLTCLLAVFGLRRFMTGSGSAPPLFWNWSAKASRSTHKLLVLKNLSHRAWCLEFWPRVSIVVRIAAAVAAAVGATIFTA